ncbi:hypothetical protein VIGAN_05191800 [Vigna angularis var. angularis]|uniref:Uncharacterized protein n=1 Tax=Vigna angularis var. angularis TaxID=157739 RepID=A0A0S3S6L9_PHAAN|nr:hypothetical protein VIGAN_05191800 [Vigna angularis var. angularis]
MLMQGGSGTKLLCQEVSWKEDQPRSFRIFQIRGRILFNLGDDVIIDRVKDEENKRMTRSMAKGNLLISWLLYTFAQKE